MNIIRWGMIALLSFGISNCSQGGKVNKALNPNHLRALYDASGSKGKGKIAEQLRKAERQLDRYLVVKVVAPKAPKA